MEDYQQTISIPFAKPEEITAEYLFEMLNTERNNFLKEHGFNPTSTRVTYVLQETIDKANDLFKQAGIDFVIHRIEVPEATKKIILNYDQKTD